MSVHRFQDLFALACSPVGCPPLPWSFHCQPLLRAASDRCRSSPSRCSRSRGMFCCPGDPLDGSRSALELRIPFRQHTFGPFPTYATFDVFFSMHSRCSSLFCQVPLLSSLSLLSPLSSTLHTSNNHAKRRRQQRRFVHSTQVFVHQPFGGSERSCIGTNQCRQCRSSHWNYDG